MNKTFKGILFFSIIINIITIVLVFLLKKDLPPIVPLFYGLPVSTFQLVQNNLLIIPPVVAISLSFINFIIVRLTVDKFLEKIFSGVIFTTTLLSLITVIKIIFLVGNF